MSMSNELRRTLSDPKPLYALAGAGDLAAEKLRDAPMLLTGVAETVTSLANRIAAETPERIATVQARLAEVPGAVDPRAVASTLDPRTARDSLRGVVGNVDTQALRDKAQTLALIQVGRVLEAAGKAVETYDGLAVRGKSIVERYRGNGEGGEGSASDVTVVVEQVIVDEEEPLVTETETYTDTDTGTDTDAATAADPVSGSSVVYTTQTDPESFDADETGGSAADTTEKPAAKSGSAAGSSAGGSRARSGAKPKADATQAKKSAAAPRKRASAPKSAKA